MKFTMKDALKLMDALKINKEKVSPKEFLMGLNVELEHGRHDHQTNVTNDDPIKTAKIAWAHLKELPDYYTRLEKMENEGKSLKAIDEMVQSFGDY